MDKGIWTAIFAVITSIIPFLLGPSFYWLTILPVILLFITLFISENKYLIWFAKILLMIPLIPLLILGIFSFGGLVYKLLHQPDILTFVVPVILVLMIIEIYLLFTFDKSSFSNMRKTIFIVLGAIIYGVSIFVLFFAFNLHIS